MIVSHRTARLLWVRDKTVSRQTLIAYRSAREFKRPANRAKRGAFLWARYISSKINRNVARINVVFSGNVTRSVVRVPAFRFEGRGHTRSQSVPLCSRPYEPHRTVVVV